MTTSIKAIFLICLLSPFAVKAQSKRQKQQGVVLTTLMQNPDLNRWIKKDSVNLQFKSFHTQGLTKVGDYFYLTAVAVKRWPKMYKEYKKVLTETQEKAPVTCLSLTGKAG